MFTKQSDQRLQQRYRNAERRQKAKCDVKELGRDFVKGVGRLIKL